MQIEEEDVTNAAYGSDTSFFAGDAVSEPVVIRTRESLNIFIYFKYLFAN